MSLVPFRGRLYAGLGYWTDVPGDDPYPGAQVLCKDGASAEWRVDAAFGPEYLRVEALAVLRFSTDAAGRPLPAPVEMLAAGPGDIRRGARFATAWTRGEVTGAWTPSLVAQEPAGAGVRSLGLHRDRVTGVDHVFAGVSRGAIHRGGYDPGAPGRLRWEAEPELEGTGRVMVFAEADGALYAAAGLEESPAGSGQVGGGLFRRVDGPDPRWERVYAWPYTPVENGDEANLLRGLTAVGLAGAGGGEVLLGTRAHPGVVERIDPGAGHVVAVELDIRAHFARAWGLSSYTGPALSAYNSFLPVTDPATGEAAHLVSLWVDHPSWRVPPNNASHYLVRWADGSYSHGDVWDPASPVPAGERLRATRAIAASPFASEAGRVFYFGGYDGARTDNHETAWIYKGVAP
jgi:hypothetical protein